MAWALLADLDQVLPAIVGAHLGWLAIAFFIGLSGMFGLGLGWRRALALVGLPSSPRTALRWYFVGQLGKYLPGGIWAVVGSAELAVGAGASRARGYGAMALSLGAAYLAAMLTVVAFLPFQPALVAEAPASLLFLAAIPLGLLAVHPKALGWLLSVGSRIAGRPIELEVPSWGASFRLILRHVPVWMGVGLAFWCVVRSLGVSAPFGNVAAAGVLAWLVGFLAVPAPGGLGVREAVFTLAATSLSPGIGAAVAILSRVLFMGADAVGALLMILVPTPAPPAGGAVVCRGEHEQD